MRARGGGEARRGAFEGVRRERRGLQQPRVGRRRTLAAMGRAASAAVGRGHEHARARRRAGPGPASAARPKRERRPAKEGKIHSSFCFQINNPIFLYFEQLKSIFSNWSKNKSCLEF
jgi:hypothetical protein